MVIILQQTMDNGKRFVSTVVEEETSFHSNFSVGSSHNSISERSAIYKQRIDSLFGRHTRLNPFKPTLEPFSIRIENSRHHYNGNFDNEESAPRSATTTTTTQAPSSVLHHLSHSSFQVSSTPGGTSSALPPPPVPISPDKNSSEDSPVQDADFSSSDEDSDDYEKIEGSNNRSSYNSDSLNERPSPMDRKYYSNNRSGGNHCASKLWLANNKHNNSSNNSSSINIGTTHVSSVRLNCDSLDNNDSCLSSVKNKVGGSCSPIENSEMATSKTIGESHMWHNGSYAQSSCTGDEQQYGIVRAMPGGILKFTVDYLGCIPVDGTTTALQDLQAPLRSLYMNYLTGTNVMGGKLSITVDGLRFEAPKLRLVNPFATIAVWAAIKFVARNDGNVSECAFMPLISDPEGQDKSRLFGKMSPDLNRAYTNCLNNKQQSFRNPPIFACVMREASFSLDCHAFACKCAEDAIVIAANLYQSLVDKMRAVNKEGESGYGSLSRNSPATSGSQGSPNQNRSSSSASSQGSPGEVSGNSSSGACCERDKGEEGCALAGSRREHRVVFSDSESVVPVRPPRRKKKSSEVAGGNLKRYNSDDSVIVKMPHRRRSFKGNHPQNGKTKKRVQISTPDETTSSDSVNECIDQVLDRVIHPGGMSFNDLKPPYQELILKIALTLTQDQLYQKSKQAMKKHQQVNFRKKPAKGSETSDDNSQFLHMLLKSFSKITSSSSKSTGPTSRKLGKGGHGTGFKGKMGHPPKVILKKSREEDPFQSFCSGCACDKCSEKCYCSLPSKHNVKVIGLPPAPSTTPGSGMVGKVSKGEKNDGHQDVESHLSEQQVDKLKKKTCGYDTDSCAESEKCYCSLQRVKSNGLKIYNINLDTETSDTDTNSYDFEPFNKTNQESVCSSSNTKGAAVSRSVEILSYHPSKRITYNLSSSATHVQTTTNAVVHFEENQPQKSTNSSSSGLAGSTQGSGNNCKGTTRNHSVVSSYLHSAPDETLSSESMSNHQRNKVLLITGSNPSTRLMYKDSHYYDGKKSRADHRSNLMDINEDDDVSNADDEGSYPHHHHQESSNDDDMAPERILSMKKTAEIAAMFTDLHLDQTTNIVPEHNSSSFADSSQTQDESNNASLDFEQSLGYLP